MRHQHFLPAMTCLSACLAAPVFALEPLPTATLRLSCNNLHSADVLMEVSELETFLARLAEHDGMAVYLDIIIAADNGAGDCARVTTGSQEDNSQPRILFSRCRGNRCADGLQLIIVADGPPLVVPITLILPAESGLPNSLPYRKGDYGDWLNFQGPFIVDYAGGTGFSQASLHVPDPALNYIWERASLNQLMELAP